MSAKHTPLPYKISGRCKEYCKSERCGYVWIDAGSFHQGTGFDEGTAEFIVRACNSHYELLEALEAMLGDNMPTASEPGHIDYGQACKMARAAIAKAKGE